MLWMTDRDRPDAEHRRHASSSDRPRISIVDALQAKLRPDGNGFEDDLRLPDETAKPGEFGWGHGTLDNMTWRRFPHRENPDIERQARRIHAALKSYAARPSDARLVELVTTLQGPSAGLFDEVTAILTEQPIPNRSIAHSGVRRIAETTSRREELKLALVLLGFVGDSSDNGLLKLAGMHGEFTPYAALAISLVNRDPVPALLDLAPATNGWGRVTIIESLLHHDVEPVRDYILRRGFKGLGFELGFEVALWVANQCRLLDAIRGAEDDAELIRGVGDVLYCLAMSPYGEFEQYKDGAAATIEFLRHFEPVADRLGDYGTVETLEHWLKFDVEGEGPVQAWSAEDRASAAGLARAILGKPMWRGAILAALDDPKQRNLAIQLSGGFDLPIQGRVVGWLRENPLDGYLWFRLCNAPTAGQMDEALALANEILDVAAIATGPEESMGLGPGFERHQCVDSLLQALRGLPDGVSPRRPNLPDQSGFPGKGEEILLAALRSPVTRQRNVALKAIEAWPQELITPRLYAAVESATYDPVVKTRQQADGLFKKMRRPLAN
jgi:hypothetical protein